MKKVCALLTFMAAALSANPPSGWYKYGSKPGDYDVYVDNSVTYLGQPSVKLKSNKNYLKGLGTLMQDFKADQYRGKRVRFMASLNH